MNSIVNLMGKYDHRQHELSDWLAELEQRFQLGQVEADRAKITWCQLLMGDLGSKATRWQWHRSLLNQNIYGAFYNFMYIFKGFNKICQPFPDM